MNITITIRGIDVTRLPKLWLEYYLILGCVYGLNFIYAYHMTVFGYKYFSSDDVSFLFNPLDPLSILVRVIFFYLLLDKMVKFHDFLIMYLPFSHFFFPFNFLESFEISRSCWPVLMKRIITVIGAHDERLPACFMISNPLHLDALLGSSYPHGFSCKGSFML